MAPRFHAPAIFSMSSFCETRNSRSSAAIFGGSQQEMAQHTETTGVLYRLGPLLHGLLRRFSRFFGFRPRLLHFLACLVFGQQTVSDWQ